MLAPTAAPAPSSAVALHRNSRGKFCPHTHTHTIRTPQQWGANGRLQIIITRSSHYGQATSRTSHQQLETGRQQQVRETTNTAAVELLERSYEQDAVPGPQVSQDVEGREPPFPVSTQLRPLYIRHALPILRTIKLTERRLEADLLTVATTVMLVVGVIVWDRGIENMLDGLLGESPPGSVSCILVGLMMVVGVRLAGGKVRDIFSV